MIFKLYYVILLLYTFTAVQNVVGQSVIVIGAGASGIAAASRLLENGISDLTILEAGRRIGGRVHSVKFGDVIEDLGAEWCHGEDGNLIYEMVKNMNLLKPSNPIESYRYSFPNEHWPFIDHLNIILDDIFINRTAREGVTLGDYITKKFYDTLSTLNLNNVQKEVANNFLRMFAKEVLWDEGAFSWFDPSAVTDLELYNGNQYLNWNGRGYKTILDVVMKKYPNVNNVLPVESKIIFGKEVARIKWDNDKVLVKCLDGSEYFSDHVIFTPSLGVLKARHSTLFVPPLPTRKVNAIATLGIGGVAKVFLHFPSKVWRSNNMFFMWTEDELSNLVNEFPLGPNKNGRSWLESLYGVVTTTRNPSVMIAWFMGEFVAEIEEMDNNILIDGIKYVLDKFYAGEWVNRPDMLLRRKWYSDPYFRGAYSYQTLEARRHNISREVELAEPLSSKSGKKTLMFAGEATSANHFSTVHGAIETGYREAERIINIYRN